MVACFSVPACVSGGLSRAFVSVGVVGVFKALKSPYVASPLAGVVTHGLS